MPDIVAELAKQRKSYAGEPGGAAARFRFYDALMRRNKSVAGGRGGPHNVAGRTVYWVVFVPTGFTCFGPTEKRPTVHLWLTRMVRQNGWRRSDFVVRQAAYTGTARRSTSNKPGDWGTGLPETVSARSPGPPGKAEINYEENIRAL